VPGELIKAVNLTPYSLDPTPGEAGDNMTYRPSNSDDIIYGGLGNDFLHGGADDDPCPARRRS
jgi:Ca2+-binding RTX toxin-like protein